MASRQVRASVVEGVLLSEAPARGLGVGAEHQGFRVLGLNCFTIFAQSILAALSLAISVK